jgi:hypothetical protein
MTNVYKQASDTSHVCHHRSLTIDETGSDNGAIRCLECSKRWTPDRSEPVQLHKGPNSRIGKLEEGLKEALELTQVNGRLDAADDARIAELWRLLNSVG